MNIEEIISKLRDLTLDFFSPTPEFDRLVGSQIDYNRPLGSGATSTTYSLVNEPSVIVKVYRPCLAPPQFAINRLNCRDMHDPIQIIVLPHDRKKILLISNYLAEGVIGGLLSRIRFYTPHFIETYGVYFSRFYNSAYTVMERGRTDWEDVLKTRNDVYILLFQVAHALWAAQTLLRFTDYDLHTGNIVFIDPKASSYQYHINGQTIYLNNPTFIAKLIDFGMARAEDQVIVVNGKNDRIPYPARGVFNPFYDFAMLLSPRLMNDNSQINIQIRELLGRENLTGLYHVVFGIDGSIDEIYQNYYNRDLRPIEFPPTPYAGIGTIVSYLVSKIVGFSSQPDDDVWNTVPLPEVREPRRSTLLNFNEVDEGIHISNHSTISYDGRRPLYYHVVTMNPAVAVGYRFGTRCCKLDPIDYLRDKYGVSINGTFFDLVTTYQPIGPYRELVEDQWFESNLQIPDLYANFYGFISIQDGQIDITKNRTGLTGDVFRSGPILVWDGKSEITEQSINQVRTFRGRQVPIFHCRQPDPIHQNDKVFPIENGYTFNCNMIQAGELSHGANPNPRSMLIIRQNGEVLFVVLEGRNERSQGADFLDMARLAIDLGAWKAINLDGGQSSNIAFRSPNDPDTVYSMVRLSSYPVGNIISFTYEDGMMEII